MITKFHTILRALCDPGEGKGPITGIRAGAQFAPEKEGPDAQLRNLNAAFLISLCGPSHPLFETVEHYLSEKREAQEWKQAARFYDLGRGLITREFLDRGAVDNVFAEKVTALYDWIRDHEHSGETAPNPDRVWQVFFPEGVGLLENREEHIRTLRERRAISIDRLNPDPMQDPAKELLFTANALLTVPPDDLDIVSLRLSATVRNGIERAREEPQLFWYDHPVQIGTPVQRNEIVYGLQELNRAIAFEKTRKTIDRHARVCCVLSVSVTHKGLREIAGQYLREILRSAGKMEHLRVFAFTEAGTIRMVEQVLVPAAKRWFGTDDTGLLDQIFGVDGEYGRHYSFLKAVAAFWQVFVDPGLRGTFKIDLDQVFPQEQLVRETGLSALEHFRTPLWGAKGIDFQGRRVDLGMIAGALVNQEDSKTSLFIPDVPFPSGDLSGSEWIFFSRLPQAVSTEAEMMTRYGKPPLDGLHRVIQRVHVTGGTTGILVDRLRKYRPFTPGFVGRAEDQAYLLSMLGRNNGKPLRSLHKSGLIMRHDKEAFAEEAIQAAAMGKKVGEYIRVLIFSSYARAIHDDMESMKKEMDPFTGCFISHLPNTIVYLRFALDVAWFFQAGKHREANGLAKMGIQRIGEIVPKTTNQENTPKDLLAKEKRAWDLYYDILDRAEQELKKGDVFAQDLQKKAHRIVRSCDLSSL
ncbi:MAG: hypothetical protein JRI80_11800 [Deltaproteobacteria bacterium]|nr:hypothetical protein [Deltaproteobacteria bacterium]